MSVNTLSDTWPGLLAESGPGPLAESAVLAASWPLAFIGVNTMDWLLLAEGWVAGSCLAVCPKLVSAAAASLSRMELLSFIIGL